MGISHHQSVAAMDYQCQSKYKYLKWLSRCRSRATLRSLFTTTTTRFTYFAFYKPMAYFNSTTATRLAPEHHGHHPLRHGHPLSAQGGQCGQSVSAVGRHHVRLGLQLLLECVDDRERRRDSLGGSDSLFECRVTLSTFNCAFLFSDVFLHGSFIFIVCRGWNKKKMI